MRRIYATTAIMILLCMQALCCMGRKDVPERPRILISTDIGGTDPDDNQSMAHLLMYSNEFDIEGLVSSPSYGKGSTKEIIRMVRLYEQVLPTLRKHAEGWPEPGQLLAITKQGRRGAAPLRGYDKATDGSEWIVRCARKEDCRPLYVLVWGGLEDVAQALHDAPDIAGRIRVYWIGGPNKKWSLNSYVYVAENFPSLWFIEDNASYRGFIYDSKNNDRYNAGYFNTYIKGAGVMGEDFAGYYMGNPKLGDTPSLLYMMDGNPADPSRRSWGGSFCKTRRSSRRVFRGTTTAEDTVAVYGIMELWLKGPRLRRADRHEPRITLTIDKQQWDGYYMGRGRYMVRFSTYKTGTLPYSVTSSAVGGFKPLKGAVTFDSHWPGKPCKDDYPLGDDWYTDRPDAALYWHGQQGAMTTREWREEIMEDWGRRWQWLKEEK